MKATVARNIRKYRRKRGMTQRELGEKLGLKAQSAITTISRMERGEVVPSMTRIQRLARIFGVRDVDMLT